MYIISSYMKKPDTKLFMSEKKMHKDLKENKLDC